MKLYEQVAVATIGCDYCGAAAGERCRSRISGRLATPYQHEARSRPFRELWIDGHREGTVTGLDCALYAIDHSNDGAREVVADHLARWRKLWRR